MLQRFGRGNGPGVGSAGYRHPVSWSTGSLMPPTFLIQEELRLPVTGEPSTKAAVNQSRVLLVLSQSLCPGGSQQTASNCASSMGEASSQSVRLAIQLFPAVPRRAPALWAVWAWQFLSIHFTLEKTRLLSGFCSVNKLNRSRRAPFPISLLRSLFTM